MDEGVYIVVTCQVRRTDSYVPLATCHIRLVKDGISDIIVTAAVDR